MDEISQRILATYTQLERDSLDLDTLFEFVGGNLPARREAVLDTVSSLVKKRLLMKEGGGDFYRRTVEGRLAVAGPTEITLYTREGCHLCEEAKTIIGPLLSEFGTTLREVDIDEDPALHDCYTNDVPVVFLGPQVVAHHRVDSMRLRALLEHAKR
jgi:glutaredoxin